MEEGQTAGSNIGKMGWAWPGWSQWSEPGYPGVCYGNVNLAETTFPMRVVVVNLITAEAILGLDFLRENG